MAKNYNYYFSKKDSGTFSCISENNELCSVGIHRLLSSSTLNCFQSMVEVKQQEMVMIKKIYHESNTIIYKSLYHYHLLDEEIFNDYLFYKETYTKGEIKYILRVLYGLKSSCTISENGVVMNLNMVKCSPINLNDINYDDIHKQVVILRHLGLSHPDIKPENIMGLNGISILVDMDNLITELMSESILSDSRFYRHMSYTLIDRFKCDKFIIQSLSGKEFSDQSAINYIIGIQGFLLNFQKVKSEKISELSNKFDIKIEKHFKENDYVVGKSRNRNWCRRCDTILSGLDPHYPEHGHCEFISIEMCDHCEIKYRCLKCKEREEEFTKSKMVRSKLILELKEKVKSKLENDYAKYSKLDVEVAWIELIQ